jgi:ankyrin repeat protein
MPVDNAPDRNSGANASFQEELSEALAIVTKLNERFSGYSVYESIRRQLEALTQWTANGRRPTPQEEQSINVGVIAVRELDDDSSPEVQALSELLKQINYDLDRLANSAELCNAAGSGDLARVRKLLDFGASPNSRNSTRISALELAASYGRFEVVELLISRGATATNQALQWAATAGSARTVEKLLEHGAEAAAKDGYGVSAIFFAVSGGVDYFTTFLLDPLNKRPKPTKPPKAEYREVIKILIVKGADVNEKFVGSDYKRGFGTTPLMVAAALGHDEIYQLLLELGADPGIQDTLNRTAADWKRPAS